MINIFECMEHLENEVFADDLRDVVIAEFEGYVEEQGLEYSWVSDNHVVFEIDEEDEDNEFACEDIEFDLREILEGAVDVFLENIEEDEEY